MKYKVYKTIHFRKNNPNFLDNLNHKLYSVMTHSNINCDHAELPCISCHVNNFISASNEVFNECCPNTTKTIQVIDGSKKWFNANVHTAKKNLRKAEKKIQEL